MKHYIGVDWSSQYDDICIINEKEEVVKEFRVNVDKEGFNFLENVLENLACNKKNIFIGIETDKNILAEYLMMKDYSVYSLNPFSVKKFKQIFSPSINKNDRLDAKAIANMLCLTKNKFSQVSKSSAKIEELEIHIATEEMLIKQRTRLIQQIRTTLSLYFPAFSNFFNDFSTSVPINLLKYIRSANDISNLSYNDYLKLIENIKYMSSIRKKDFYHTMKEKAIDLKSPTVRAYICKVSILADDLIVKNDQIKEINSIIENIYIEHHLCEVFSSLPSAGKKLAPKLLVNFGDNKERFPSYQSVQCYSGTAPTFEESGKYLSLVKMRRACKKPFRNALQQFAFCTLKTEPWAREYYDKLKAKGKNHSAAVRALANKW